MFLKDKRNGHMVEILGTNDLFNLYRVDIVGRYLFGEEAQEPETFHKTDLIFLSGEELPRCWLDPEYREEENHRH